MDMKLITHTDLVERAKNWLIKSCKCGVVLTEYACSMGEIPDAIGFYKRYSILVECKVSRTDFKHNKYKSFRGLGNHRYYLTLPHVACAEDITDGWGLLYAESKRIVIVKKSQYFNSDSVKVAEWSILYSIVRRITLRGLLQEVQKPL